MEKGWCFQANVDRWIGYVQIKKLGSIGNGRLWMVLLQKHLLGEKSTGPNPTDRAKSGTKRSILVDGKGIPLGVCVDGANRHDMKMTKATLQSIVIYRPDPTIRSKTDTCAWTKATSFQRYTNYWKSMVIQFTSD